MRLFPSKLGVAMSVVVGGLFITACDSAEPTKKDETKPTPTEQAKTPPTTKPIIPIATVADWCPEHGLPESICTLCNESLVEGFKQKGDWCEEHKVPKSQDFAHNPELKAKFAAAYKEKYGKDAPKAD